MPIQPCRNAMKLVLLLPFCVHGWWCETSAQTGCRGHSRHFVREVSARNPFLAFADIKTSRKDDAIVVDWDSDGDLDVILRTTTELLLFESKPGGKFVRVEPNPFKGIPGNPFSSSLIGDCMPAVVDWDRDGELDLIIGAKDGIEFYHRGFDRELHQRTGADNPFQHIRTKKGGPCSDLSVADWDGDGDLDLLVSDLHLPMRYFEQVDGRLVSVDEDRNPFHHILQNSIHRRPFMVDWNGDGRLELLLMPNILERLGHAQGFFADELCSALARWWERHRIVSGAGLEDGIYMWWCVFVNNQFRMLEAGQVEEPDDLFDVFGQQLQGIGKMLMCLDKMRGGQYTTRIWCIFEVFVACQRSIPTTVILPELEVGAIASLEELTHECRVDAEQAKASVQADADAIKDHIKQKHQSFEYVNRTVEHALWCEVIEFLESSKKGGAGRPSQLGPGSTSTGPPTSGPAESTMSESMATDMAAEHGKCNLQ